MADHDSITADELRSILHYNPETGIFTRLRSPHPYWVGKVVGYADKDGYLRICIKSRFYSLHRLAWLYVYGTWPKDQIDHINRIRSDNRICNLRDVTNQQNMCNTGNFSNNTSGRKGVYWVKRERRWRPSIRFGGKTFILGTFKNFEDAVAARVAAEKLYWSQLAL